MATHKTIISMPIFGFEVAVSVSGLDDQSPIGKQFEDSSKLAEQITWDMISNGNNLLDAELKNRKLSKMKFGLSKEEYHRIHQAYDLQLLFDLDDNQSEVAFNIAKQEDADMEKVFAFVADYCVFLDYDLTRQDITYDTLFSIFNASPELRFVYLYVIDEIGTAIDLVGEIKVLGYDPLSFSPDFLKLYVEEDSMNFKEFNDLAEKYIMIHGELDSYFSEFLLKYKYDMDFDDAIYEEDYSRKVENALTSYDMFEDDYDEHMQKWIDDETNYANSDRFDDNYEEDSAYYEGENPFYGFL